MREVLLLKQKVLFKLKGKPVATIKSFERDKALADDMDIVCRHNKKDMLISNADITHKLFKTSAQEYKCKVVPGRKYSLYYVQWKEE